MPKILRVDTVSVGLQFLINTNRSDQKFFRVVLTVQPCSTTSKQFLEKFGLGGFTKNWNFQELSTALSHYQDLVAAWEMSTRWRGYPEIYTELMSIKVLRNVLPAESTFSNQRTLDSFFSDKHQNSLYSFGSLYRNSVNPTQ